MDAQTIQNEILRLSSEMRSRRDEARKLRTSATGNRSSGNNDLADADEKQAASLEQEADTFEQQAKSAESHLATTLVQIRSIEQKQNELKADFERSMAELQNEKDRLQGGLGNFSSTMPSIF